MKTSRKQVIDYLYAAPEFRERKNKNRGIANLLVVKYPFLTQLKEQTILDICTDFATMNRWWSRILQQQKELRGNDYHEKVKLQTQAKQKYGYGKKA